MKNDSTIIGSWALVQCSVMRHSGLDPERYYQDEGLDFSAIGNPQYRFPAEPFNRIWYRISHDTNNPAIGLIASQFVLPTTFHALGLAMWSSSTAQDALERLVRFSQIINDGGGGVIESDDKQLRLIIHRDRNADNIELMTDIGIDCFCGSLITLFRQLSGALFRPKAVYLKRTAPENSDAYTQYYQCEVHFAADQDALIFDRQLMIEPLATGNSELAKTNDSAAEHYLSRIKNDDIIYELHQRIINHLTGGEVSQEKIAADLAMSVRTLQRALKTKDTSFKHELDSVRKHLANDYLSQPQLSLGEISYLLGFTQPNNFSRSFKQWYQVSPTQYRVDRFGLAPQI